MKPGWLPWVLISAAPHRSIVFSFQHLSPSMQNNGFLCLLHGINFIFVLQDMDCGTIAPYMGGGLSVKGFVNALS